MNTSNKKSTLESIGNLSTSETFLAKYKKAIIVGSILVVIIVVLLVGGKVWFQQRENKAQSLLTLGQTYYTQQEYDKALKGDGKFPGYLKIASEYHFTNAANLANFYAGLCYEKKGDIKNAIKYLEKYSVKGDHTISPSAVAALANCYADNNQLNKAIEKFKEAAKLADNASMSPEYLILAGELLLKNNQKDEAKKVFETIKENYPLSKYSTPSQSSNGVITDPLVDSYIELSSK